jgi:molybdenum cofactor cytidylyltransferase
MSVAAVILAAGRGSRFGEAPKVLAHLAGKPLVRRVAEAALASSARPVLLVAGHRRDEVALTVAGLPLEVIANPRYADGLSTSLRAAFERLPTDAEAAVILLADMPLVGAALIDRLVGAWAEAGRPAALIPTHGGRQGNPVILSTVLRREIGELTGDSGAGPILRGRSDVVLHAVDDRGVLQDVDTTDALARLARAEIRGTG